MWILECFFTIINCTAVLRQLSGLVEIEQLLHRVKPQYLRPKRFVRTKGSWMSEEDKDELDAVREN